MLKQMTITIEEKPDHSYLITGIRKRENGESKTFLSARPIAHTVRREVRDVLKKQVGSVLESLLQD